MSIELITVAMIGTLLLLLVIGMPMALALGFVAVAFAFAFFGWNALQLISSRIYGFVGVYVLLAVPMFLLMAAIMDRSGVARDLYDAMSIWAGGLPGGVAVMTLIAAVFMAATTGIIGGEIILLGLVYLVGLGWFSGMQAFNSIRIVEMSGRAWNVPMPMIIRTAFFIGTALFALQTAVEILKLIRPRR